MELQPCFLILLIIAPILAQETMENTTEVSEISEITSTEPADPDLSFSCDFENNLCEFSTPHTECTWRHHKGNGTNFPTTGPPSGRTSGSKDDGYLYFESDRCSLLDNTATITTSIDAAHIRNTSQCLKFWYFMYGGPRSLDVSVIFDSGTGPTVERKEFHREGNQGRRWFEAHVTIDNEDKKSYNLSFTAGARTTSNQDLKLGDIAIDDVDFSDGGCEATKDLELCDFESGNLCNFTSTSGESDTGVHWSLMKAGSIDAMPVQKVDHTFQTSEGHIAYSDLHEGQTGRLISQPVLCTGSNQRVTFWYQVAPLGQLGLHIKSAGVDVSRADWNTDDPVWSANSSFASYTGWNFASVLVAESCESAEAFIYAFEASKKTPRLNLDQQQQTSQYLMLDDIMVDDSSDLYEPPACNFEKDMGGWTTSGLNYDIGNSWVRFKAKDNLGVYGPYVDNTLGSPEGHFVMFSTDTYTETTNSIAMGTLWSPKVSQSAPATICFSFWHFTYKDRGASMNLSLILHEPDTRDKRLIQFTEPPQNRWTYVNVSFEVRGDYRLAFDNSFFNASRGNVLALDDFQAKTGNCHYENYTCANGEKIYPWKVCDGKYDCTVCDGKYDCTDDSDESSCGNFTSLFASVENADSMNYNFTKFTGYTITNSTTFRWQYTPHCNKDQEKCIPPPPTGHNETTSKLGFFKADFNSSVTDTGSTYLHSPTIQQVFSTTNMTFWYNIYTLEKDTYNDTGALVVSVQMISTNTIIALLDVKAIPNANHSVGYWQKHEVTVGRMQGPFHFLFQARKAHSYDGFIAIDEIVISDRMFPTPHLDNDGKCGNRTLWQCPSTRVCIEQDRRCDYTDDCGQFDDEIKCQNIQCSFDDDNSFLFWENHSESDVHWIHTTTRTSTPYSGPLRDHTTGLTGGGYLHAPSVKGNVTKGHRAILLSPPQKPAEKNEACWMRFYYHMFGEDMGSLNVTTETYRTSSKPPSVSVKQIFYIEGNHGDHWIRQSVPLESEEPFRVAFIATVGGIRSDIALDDVSFSKACRLLGATFPPASSSSMSPVTRTSRSTGKQLKTTTTRDPLADVFSKAGLGGGEIAGIVFGLLIILAGGFVLLVLFVKRGSSLTSTTLMPRGVWSRDRSSSYQEFTNENLEL